MKDSKTVLVIDDDQIILSLVRKILDSAGFDVQLAASGEAGLSILKNQPESPAVILTDYALSGISGVELTGAIRSLAPTLPVIISSGTRVSLDRYPPELCANLSVLHKPYRASELIESVRAAMGQPEHPRT